MRINKLQLAGLAVALVGAGAEDASANDVTVSTATTTPLVTSAPDGATPGDVTVASGGSITVSAGQTAVTVDSDNDVTVAAGGRLASSDADATTGIRLLPGNSGIITHNGVIDLSEAYTRTDTDNDGDPDGVFAEGVNRHGIFLESGGSFTGDILGSGSITIEGNSSSGITLEGMLIGDLNRTGAITITGDNSAAIAILGGVTGDVLARGGVTARGVNVSGLIADSPISGALRLSGSWSVSGYTYTGLPLTQQAIDNLDADDLQQSGSAVDVRFSVGNGITFEGIGVEDDDDDDNDGDTADADDNAGASIIVFGSAPTVHIHADPSADLLLGATASGYGLHNRGVLAADGVFEGMTSTALRIEGQGGRTVDITGGVLNDGAMRAFAREADATAIYIGVGANVPEFVTRSFVQSVSSSETTGDALGVVIDVGANLPALNNSGVIRAQVNGEATDAVAIRDLSNSLSLITNSGTIEARHVPTDDDLTDNVTPPITGNAIAIDLSNSSVNVTLNQVADTPFTDDDATDDDVNARPDVKIVGDIFFGSGDDALNLLAGEITGDVAFGIGADTLVIDNGAEFFGRLSDSDGALTINVIDGELNHTGGQTNVTSATFGANSVLGIALSDAPGESTLIVSSGAITFESGASLSLSVPAGLPDSGVQTFLTANGGLVGGNNVLGALTGVTPFLYNLDVDFAQGDPNSLAATYALKTAGELGLTPNQAAIYLNMVDALRLDDAAAAAMSSIVSAGDFFDAYEDLMPSYASGATELAATAVQQMQSATSNRLAATRLHEVEQPTVWAQEIGYGLQRTPATPNGQEFEGQGFGFAVGIDGPLQNGALFGLSGSFIASEVEEAGRPDGEIAAWFGQANAYLGAGLGIFDLDFIVGAGAGKLRSQRFVEIGDTFSAISEGDWWAYEGHGAGRISAPLRLGESFVITPQAALTYVALNETAYTEGGGGAAIDYDVDDAFSQRLWGDAGVEFSARWRLRSGGVVAPRLFAGYRSNLIDEGAERTVRFASGGSAVTLTDENLGDGGPLVGLGLDASNGYSTFSIGYEGEFGDQVERHSLNAAIRFRF